MQSCGFSCLHPSFTPFRSSSRFLTLFRIKLNVQSHLYAKKYAGIAVRN
uniref:Uncharacterized protein n=1 Tax=Populus trichocarpa TaxID=3694 RepID=A0A3N7G1K7_POPTR